MEFKEILGDFMDSKGFEVGIKALLWIIMHVIDFK